ncbi:MAG TPA: PIG-L family deacetylase, partial [Archangium sp.]|nr:PIG-L family deacetylase [Archangium sp.]
VTDETAAMTPVTPDEPLLRGPNPLTAADFEGWVQERGLYFASTWDARYWPVFAMSDAGEAPLQGSLLVSRHGKGTFVYTGIAFFRQLPSGVPGAYRLLANLLAQ